MRRKQYAVEQKQGPVYPDKIRAGSVKRAKEIYSKRYGCYVSALKAKRLTKKQ